LDPSDPPSRCQCGLPFDSAVRVRHSTLSTISTDGLACLSTWSKPIFRWLGGPAPYVLKCSCRNSSRSRAGSAMP
jgi:hypothetical protein